MRKETMHTVEAPEELLVWTLKHPWEQKFFNDRGVRLLAVKVDGKEILGNKSTRKFTLRNPFKLLCGIDIRSGQESKLMHRNFIATFRCDGANELKEAMVQLCDYHGVTAWKIKMLEVYNSNEGATLIFKWHSPNNTGHSLYLHDIDKEGKKRSWEEVYLNEQLRLCGDFKNRQAHCGERTVKVKERYCIIKGGQKSTQIKLRKKKQPPTLPPNQPTEK